MSVFILSFVLTILSLYYYPLSFHPSGIPSAFLDFLSEVSMRHFQFALSFWLCSSQAQSFKPTTAYKLLKRSYTANRSNEQPRSVKM